MNNNKKVFKGISTNTCDTKPNKTNIKQEIQVYFRKEKKNRKLWLLHIKGYHSIIQYSTFPNLSRPETIHIHFFFFLNHSSTFFQLATFYMVRVQQNEPEGRFWRQRILLEAQVHIHTCNYLTYLKEALSLHRL